MEKKNPTVDKLKENLTCPICLELFDRDRKLAKALPCMHTICFQCVDQYIGLQNRYNCPICREVFKTPVGGTKALRTNTMAMNMLDLLPKEVEFAKPKCDLHGYKECVFLCRECKVGLCNTCMRTVMLPAKNNEHIISVHSVISVVIFY